MNASNLSEVLILDAVRTPIGKHGGALAHVRPDDLAAAAIAGLLDRHPRLDPASIDDVLMGDANGAGEDNRNVARMAWLLSGRPASVPGATVNRLCGSGLEAVIQGSRAVAVGDAGLILAGGVESMSRAPWVLAKPETAYSRGHETLHSTTLGWRLVNPEMPSAWTASLGECTEALAAKFAITREAQDEFAAASHVKADAAWRAGMYAAETVLVPGATLERDETIRPDSTAARLARLTPVFRTDGTITAGNASPLNDGAAALLLASPDGATASGIAPLARIVSRGVAALDPRDFGIGPVEAANQALARAGLSWHDLAVVELNEAFAAQALACLASWKDLDAALVNPHGGAIAIGHPLGASGARVVTSLAHELHRRALAAPAGSGPIYGLATICIGVGQGLAVVLQGL